MATKSGAKKRGGTGKAGAKKGGGTKRGAARKAASKKSGVKGSGTKKAGAKGASQKARGVGRAETGRAETGVRARTLETVGALNLAAAEPTTNECIIWRNGSFRGRVLLAVAMWSQENPSNIAPGDTLGSLAKGVSWEDGPGQQLRLVDAVNNPNIDVFAPFSETEMDSPTTQFPASTTVAQWERIVWQHQSPRTPCFFKAP